MEHKKHQSSQGLVGALVIASIVGIANYAAADAPKAPTAMGGAESDAEHTKWIQKRLDLTIERLKVSPDKATKLRQIISEELKTWETTKDKFAKQSKERAQARREVSHRIEDRMHALLTCEERERYRLSRRELFEERFDHRLAMRHQHRDQKSTAGDGSASPTKRGPKASGTKTTATP